MQTLIDIDGTGVHIEGDGEDAILMVHGWPDTHRLWDRQVAALRGRYRCARFTLPGFDPQGPPAAPSLDETVELLRRAAREAGGGRRVILMLHDWGCLFGFEFYMRYPALVSRIVAVDIGDAGSQEYRRSLPLPQKAMLASYQLWLAGAWRLGGRVGDAMARLVARGAARMAAAPADPGGVRARMGYPYYLAWTGAYKGARELNAGCPFFFIYGRNKPVMFHTPQWERALAHKPGCRVLAMDTGHWPMTERPGPFNHAVLEWLDGR